MLLVMRMVMVMMLMMMKRIRGNTSGLWKSFSLRFQWTYMQYTVDTCIFSSICVYTVYLFECCCFTHCAMHFHLMQSGREQRSWKSWKKWRLWMTIWMGEIYILSLNKRRMIIIWQGFIRLKSCWWCYSAIIPWANNTLPCPLGKSTHPVVGKKRVNAMVWVSWWIIAGGV